MDKNNNHIDQVIIAAIKGRDEHTMREVYTRHREECVAWLMREYRMDVDKALEIYQEATCILFENIFQGKLTQLTSGLKTYLFGIAKNLARKPEPPHPPPINPELSDAGQRLPEEAFVTLEEGLRNLGEPAKSILADFYYFGLSMEEIAKKYALKSVDVAKTTKYRALQRLRKAVGPLLEKLIKELE